MKARAVIIAAFLSAGISAEGKVSVPEGTFRPMFGAEGADLGVGKFWIDRDQVTNADFEKFVRANKDWQKGKVAAAFADEKYLGHWKRGKVPAALRREPVINVSWFSAQAYCEAKGGRLPSTLEWEYVAAASKDKRDATKDPAFQQKILAWYAARTGAGPAADANEANFYGVAGLHGKVWEWTSDYNAFFVAGDNRQDGDQSKNFFCGASATNADNREGYAAFMRYALRSSLQASFTLTSLGFRCAYDHE